MMAVRVSVYENGLIRAVQTDGNDWNGKVAREVMAQAIAFCPSTTGHLKESHGVEQNRIHGAYTTGFNVYNDATVTDKKTGREKPLALFIHNGTQGPIVPVNTEKKKYLHLPSYMGFRWSKSYKLATRRKRKKGVRGPYVRTFDLTDPYGHAESVAGTPANPWLLDAGIVVTSRHG